MAKLNLPPLQHARLADFSGGVNVRDAQRALAANESPDAWNVTGDERGGVGSRLGYEKHNATAFGGGFVKNAHFSGILNNLVTQAGASLYLGTTNTARKTFTTAARCVFADFNGKVYAGHPVDGLWHTTDGVTWTKVADLDCPATVVAIAVWQEQLYVVPANSNQFWWSDPLDGTAWTSTNFNTVGEKDDEPLVALAGAGGVDVAGVQGLLAFKRESTYRIVDSEAGAYYTLDTAVGAASALSVVSVARRVVVLNQHGIYWTDGAGPMRSAGDREEPLWRPDQIAYDQLDLFAAGKKGNRVYLSLARAGSTAVDLALEFHPEQGWIYPRSDAMACYTTHGDGDEKLLGGSPTMSGQVYELLSGGTDDGAAIVSWFQIRWFEPAAGYLVSVPRAIIRGRGEGNVIVRKDFEIVGGDSYPFDLDAATQAWDSGLFWDSGLVWDEGVTYENSQDLYSIGAGRYFAFRVEATTTTTKTGPDIFGGGTGPVAGAWALYALDLEFVQLGRA